MKRNTLIAVPVELHSRIKELAKQEGATIMYMLKMMVHKWEKDHK